MNAGDHDRLYLKGAALASAVMALSPAGSRVRLSVDAVDQGLEDAARTLGCRKNPGFFSHINLPLMVPGNHYGHHSGFCEKPW